MSPREHRGVPVLPALIAALVLTVVLGGVVWQLTGGRWQIVSSPSMGTAAPVGTLVLTRPASQLAVGDIVTFHPPGIARAETTTHRVVAVDPGAPGGPTFRTKGDINGAEDSTVPHLRDVVGRAVLVAPGVGWLVRALPWLIVGGLLVWFVTRRWLSRFWAVPLRVLGFSLLVAAVVAVLKPFVGTTTLATSADATGAHIGLVSTGLLPTRVSADTGGYLDLVSGQTGVLHTALPPGARGNILTSGVHMPIWLWVLMTTVWLIPMGYGLVSAWRHPLDPDPDAGAGPPPDDRPTLDLAASTVALGASGLALAAVVSLLAATVPPSAAAFTARVTNNTNTASSAAYFTCAGALTGFGSAYLAWPLDDASVANGATARTLANGATTGTYTNGFTTAADKPCPRDTPARAVTLVPTALAPSYVATTTTTAINSSNVFSVAVWFKTTTTTGGKLMGWSNLRTGLSTTYDRHLYMTNSGQLVFGVYPNAVRTITSPSAYNNGQWHLAVATLSTAGMVLYVDGAQVAVDATTTTAEGGTTNTGFWRVGYDNLTGWTTIPSTAFWAGSMSNAAVFSSALTAAQVQQLYVAGS